MSSLDFKLLLIFSTALFSQMMESFPLDNDPDMTNHQNNCSNTTVEVSPVRFCFVLELDFCRHWRKIFTQSLILHLLYNRSTHTIVLVLFFYVGWAFLFRPLCNLSFLWDLQPWDVGKWANIFALGQKSAMEKFPTIVFLENILTPTTEGIGNSGGFRCSKA